MLGADPNPDALDQDPTESNGFSWQVTSGGGASQTTNLPGSVALFPILEDTPQEAVTTANPDPNIVDFIGTDYVIKRIVGSCHVTTQNLNASQFKNVAVTAGFFVARADDAQVLLPVGASTTALAVSNYDSNYVDTIREPWIWRRTWVLSNPAVTTTAVEAAFGGFPQANSGYGDMRSGPHIDAKTGRRVRNDERLWFYASCRGISSTNLNYTTVPTQVTTVTGYLDVRVLGALRRAKNRSNF